ncbi:MAG: hypothetical protein JW772_02590 [Candidatus Diapherotrites archaeon]|nr:hypothetical protein [Candidatus Diapherotrites archaeon]
MQKHVRKNRDWAGIVWDKTKSQGSLLNPKKKEKTKTITFIKIRAIVRCGLLSVLMSSNARNIVRKCISEYLSLTWEIAPLKLFLLTAAKVREAVKTFKNKKES